MCRHCWSVMLLILAIIALALIGPPVRVEIGPRILKFEPPAGQRP